MAIVLGLLIVHWFSSLFFQSFFLHRYCSHRLFQTNKFWEKVFYLMTFLTQGPSFLNPRAYREIHMLHHAHSDTPDDPHSPHHTKSMMHMMLKTYKQYKSIVNKVNSEKEERLHSGCPKWTSLDRFSASSASTVFWASAYIGLYFSLQISPIFYLFLPFHFFMGPIQGAIVNWFGHTLGYQNFSDGDQSKNTLPIDFALMGELYQNNHHHFGSRMNFAHRWFEVDFTYAFALILRRLGIIRFLNTN